jgi:hypothetical protein
MEPKPSDPGAQGSRYLLQNVIPTYYLASFAAQKVSVLFLQHLTAGEMDILF